MPMSFPPHPGPVLKVILDNVPIQTIEAARRLRYCPQHLDEILSCNQPIQADLAVRLERAGVSTARCWLMMQAAYDQFQAERSNQPDIELITRT